MYESLSFSPSIHLLLHSFQPLFIYLSPQLSFAFLPFLHLLSLSPSPSHVSIQTTVCPWLFQSMHRRLATCRKASAPLFKSELYTGQKYRISVLMISAIIGLLWGVTCSAWPTQSELICPVFCVVTLRGAEGLVISCEMEGSNTFCSQSEKKALKIVIDFLY